MIVDVDIAPTKQALSEALSLSDEILKDIELSRTELSVVALKCSRLARLINDFEYQKIFEYEASGYPSTGNGLESEIWKLAVAADRKYQHKAKEEIKEFVYTAPIAEIEAELETAKASIAAAQDANIAISSANPNQYLGIPHGNTIERKNLRGQVELSARRLASRRGLLHRYANLRYYELKFSGISDDIFSRVRERVDTSVSHIIPEEIKKLTAIYDNLASDNPEDWSNAVHGCRRLLQSLADKLQPPGNDVSITTGGKEKLVRMGPDNYINRLVFYIQSKSESKRFEAIVGSNLSFAGERLDALFQAAQKGSHTAIVDQTEADRCVINTYLLIGDILSL